MKHGAFVSLLAPFTEGGLSASFSGGQIGKNAEAEEEDVIEESLEEARRPRIAKRPQMLTKAEYDARMTLHADYKE